MKASTSCERVSEPARGFGRKKMLEKITKPTRRVRWIIRVSAAAETTLTTTTATTTTAVVCAVVVRRALSPVRTFPEISGLSSSAYPQAAAWRRRRRCTTTPAPPQGCRPARTAAEYVYGTSAAAAAATVRRAGHAAAVLIQRADLSRRHPRVVVKLLSAREHCTHTRSPARLRRPKSLNVNDTSTTPQPSKPKEYDIIQEWFTCERTPSPIFPLFKEFIQILI